MAEKDLTKKLIKLAKTLDKAIQSTESALKQAKEILGKNPDNNEQ